MTDAEMWLEIAAHMEGSGFIPTYDSHYEAFGLCQATYQARIAGLISVGQERRMDARLHRMFDRDPEALFIWPRGEIAPRIRACYALAKVTP